VSISGYQLVHRDHNRHEGVVCLYISESARILTADWHADAELHWVTLQLSRHKLIFGVYYRPHSRDSTLALCLRKI